MARVLLQASAMRTPRPLLAALLLVAGCPTPQPGPSQDTCDNPAPGQADALTVGTAVSRGPAAAQPSSPFIALGDGASIKMVRGFQGADMIVLRLQLHGAGLPGCIDVRVQVAAADGSRLSVAHNALNFYAATATATVQTGPIFLPGAYALDAPVTVTIDTAGQHLVRTLVVKPYGCAVLLDSCSRNCGDPTCLASCQSETSTYGHALYDQLQACLASACPGSAGDGGVTADAGLDPDGGPICDNACQCVGNAITSPPCGFPGPCGGCADAYQICSNDD
jgi:hypothetical protein